MYMISFYIVTNNECHFFSIAREDFIYGDQFVELSYKGHRHEIQYHIY